MHLPKPYCVNLRWSIIAMISLLANTPILTIENTMMMLISGLIEGSVIFQKDSHIEAPSMDAAS